jgi:hypothetical protein
MMGRERRDGATARPVSLEALVPPDDFSRHLECVLDLGFVWDLVRDADAPAGRPSVDPEVFFKTQATHYPH